MPYPSNLPWCYYPNNDRRGVVSKNQYAAFHYGILSSPSPLVTSLPDSDIHLGVLISRRPQFKLHDQFSLHGLIQWILPVRCSVQQLFYGNFLLTTYCRLSWTAYLVLSRISGVITDGFKLANKFIDQLHTSLGTTSNYSAVADFHKSQITTS
jgi:hypothetical protein